MVDLVKIRKKAREKKAPPAADPPSPPVDAKAKIEKFLETAGKRRVAETRRESAEAEQLEVLTFSIAGELYGIAIENVVEIIAPRTITRVPNAGAEVVGIVSLRGTVVTLIDARGRLHHPPATMTPETRIIVVDRQGDMLGFLVDLVLRVVKVDVAEIEPQPVVHTSEQDDSVRGVFRYKGALTILLDLDKLLAD
jgi:purine-binding chemotaxis protein CheW